MFSPRIMPWATRVKVKFFEEDDVDENLDDHVVPEKGFDKVYAVPRPRLCTSNVYIHLMNLFGNGGGFELVLDLI
jgi:hypothetical protein